MTRVDPDLRKGVGGREDGQNELRHYIVWFGKGRQKKDHSQLTILAVHLTNYTFIADKVHKNPYIARYTLL